MTERKKGGGRPNEMATIDLISKEKYEDAGGGCPAFDEYVRSRAHSYAMRDSVSELSGDKILVSEWQVPCHVIIFKTADGKYQIFHVQPNKLSASLLSGEQKESLKQKAQADAIAIKGSRSWWGRNDEEDLKEANVNLKKVIHVETQNWWRLLFDPKTNEIWIDIKDQKILRKYKGF